MAIPFTINESHMNMRKIIFCTMLLPITSISFSQKTNPEQTLTKQDYLNKSKKQKKVGSILLAGGAGLMATAFILPKGESIGNCYQGICTYKNDETKVGLFIAGGISALGSILFFRASKKNGRIASAVSLKIENTTNLYKQNLAYTSFPALKVKVDF